MERKLNNNHNNNNNNNKQYLLQLSWRVPYQQIYCIIKRPLFGVVTTTLLLYYDY